MADLTPPPGASAFLAQHGWAGAEIRPLAGDASFRRYFRVTLAGRRAVLMDAPPPHEDTAPFLSVAAWLSDRGFAAPAVHAHDPEQGLVLLEDFGDVRMRETVDQAPAEGVRFYEAAVDLLVELHRHAAGPFRAYDARELHREAALLPEWYCPAVGLAVDPDGYRAAWDAVFGHALSDAPVTVLRDYHAENLMLVGAERRLGLLDFQDAAAGHRAYDLVSLLQGRQARRRSRCGDGDAGALHGRDRAGRRLPGGVPRAGAQRNAKIIGIFTRLWKRDGKPRYPALCPRVWAYLERDLSEPVLRPVTAWFDAHVPPERRGDPQMLSA
jgi:aminoglycoside/choline kinase family phosphotransferase